MGDVNDNAPLFTSSSFSGEIVEVNISCQKNQLSVLVLHCFYILFLIKLCHNVS